MINSSLAESGRLTSTDGSRMDVLSSNTNQLLLGTSLCSTKITSIKIITYEIINNKLCIINLKERLTMRVISGKYKGRALQTLEGMNTRPMTARVKEDLFNILDNYFIYENKVGLDIFSGSGQLGIEGLSRGLRQCYLNDYHPGALKIIQNNVRNLQIENAIILNVDYQVLLTNFINNNIKIDILFLDPPFKQIDYYYDIITCILENNLLNNYGIIVCEANQALSFDNYNLVILKTKNYKNKYLYILRIEKEDDTNNE
ncbi:16S rRNA (guanine(966)-N(2))-methyltransferase RsmD [Spiroplasma sp. DGKH1]